MFITLSPTAKQPLRATSHSAGFDVYADEESVVSPGETKAIGLGIAIDEKWFISMDVTEIEAFMLTHFLELHPRSSMRMKGLIILPGIIDMDYRDEIKMIIHNPSSNENFNISKADKIGQLLLKRHEGNLLPSSYTKEAKREGGFGSTGK
ncbi:MAG: hypothetical protein U9O24_09140 [Campylobacterota bacterium]|nr:hypothetical protein [Campylobacterota bacterium]